MTTRSGSLTIFSPDRTEIYGEFRDATWEVEESDAGDNHVFTGTASDGTMETFRRLNAEGMEHVVFDFDSDGVRYSGPARMLAPEDTRIPGQAWVRIETTEAPATF